jgi:hypothetical protein
MMNLRLILVTLLCSITTNDANDAASRPIITMEELDTFITKATDYLVRVSHTPQQDSLFPGRFTYEANLKEPLDLSDHFWNADNLQDDYNLLRHNGAIYSLGMSYKRRPSPRVKEAMQRGVQYLKTDALHPVPDIENGGNTAIPNMLAAWEKTDLDDPKASLQTAKLGGAGLALIALSYLEMVQPHSTPIATLQQIGNFIEYMQHPEDGSFTCKYSYKFGKNDDWMSLYYPGEAALGLVLLAELDADHQEKWLEIATKTFLYLEGLRRNQPLDQIEPDHWALLATARLLPMLEAYDGNDMEYWLVYNHGVRVAQSMVDAHTLQGLAHHLGCFTYDRRTCPTATRLEGLLAALSFVRDSEMYIGEEEGIAQPLRERIEESIEYGIKFLLDSQELASNNHMDGGVPERYPIKNPEDDANVRVDYVQHSMSAVIAYEQYVQEKKHSGGKLVRQGMKKLKKFRENVVAKVHHKKGVNRGDAVITNADAGVNMFLLLIVSALILGVVVMVYRPHQKRRRRLKRKD